MANRAGYIRALWESVLDLKASGASLASAHSTLAVANVFPNLAATVTDMAALLGLPEAAVVAEAETQNAANVDLFWSAAP